MKVWELMAKLAECAAGAEVEMSMLTTKEELNREGVFDINENEEDMYHVHGRVDEVDDEGTLVLLNADW